MIPRHKCYGDVALRLRHAPSPPSRNSSSSRIRSLTVPLRAISCLQQQPREQRALLAALRASPPPAPLPLASASRGPIPRPAAVSVGKAQPGRHSCCDTRKLIFGPTWSTSRRFSAGAQLPSTSGKEPDGDHEGHDRRRFRAAPHPYQEDAIKLQEGQRQVQERWQEKGEHFNKEGKRQRVVVGMSGGVDSSVVAMLLQQQGYEVVGVFMRNWDGQDETGSDVCTADADLEDARRVGMHLGIPVETVDFSREYWNQVFEPSIQEFARCRTPNMDIACNRYIKFDAFREYALGKMGADLVATGHYARTSPGPNGDWSKPVLLEAEDGNKDQTYFLCGVPKEGLAKVLFPLGGLTKPEVRDLAAEAGLPVARKRESMGVCFVGKRRSWGEFISQYLTPTPGKFVCVDTGDVVGEHRGVQLYTVGQKSHLDGMPEKYYVAGLDPDTNSVIVARGKDNPTLFARGLSVLASEFNWIAGAPPAELSAAGPGGCAEEPGGERATEAARENEASPPPPGASAAEGEGGGRALETTVQAVLDTPALASQGAVRPAGSQRGPALLRCDYRSRHREALRPCTVEVVHAAKGGESGGADALVAGGAGANPFPLPLHRSVLYVRFEEPARAIAPGQVLALYRDGVCLGGGPIFRAEGHCSPVSVRSPSPTPPPH